MNRRANCHDNAVAGSVFILLSSEPNRRRAYKTSEEPRRDVFDCIEILYNPTGKRAKNGMLSPVGLVRQQKMKTTCLGSWGDIKVIFSSRAKIMLDFCGISASGGRVGPVLRDVQILFNSTSWMALTQKLTISSIFS